jgi:hypothetical protein
MPEITLHDGETIRAEKIRYGIFRAEGAESGTRVSVSKRPELLRSQDEIQRDQLLIVMMSTRDKSGRAPIIGEHARKDAFVLEKAGVKMFWTVKSAKDTAANAHEAAL